MLRRFMNWLLHQLQKVLGALSGRRSNSRPFVSDREAANTTGTKESSPALADTPTFSQTDISFSIQPAASSAQPSSALQKDAIQKAMEHADDIDTHMRLDAASSAVSGSQLELPDLDVIPGDQLLSVELIADIESANQLPSIHDLLPAVEQEIKANSAHFEEEEALIAADSTEFDRLTPEPESSDEIAEPAQALLFSFDIIESASDEADVIEVNDSIEEELTEEDVIEVEDSIEDENFAEPVQLDASPSESISKENLLEIAIAPSPETNTDPALDSQMQPISALESTEKTALENPPEPDSDISDATAFDKASLPYPWSITTPKKTSISEDKPVIQPEDAKQMRLQTDENMAAKPETVYSSPSHPVSAQPIQETNYQTKNGVVKLLFTLKEGNFHGYIEPKDGTSDILFHQKYINEDIFDSLERGVEVVVSVQYKEGKAYATQVELA